jgi:heat shock protein HslJ
MFCNRRVKSCNREGILRENILLIFITVLLGCFVNACATSEKVAGTYGAKLPSASGPARVIHLKLTDDKRAEMSTDYLNRKPAVVETGKWESGKDGNVAVTLTEKEGMSYDTPGVLAFHLQGDLLRAAGYDVEIWGSEGLVLQRQPDITGKVWHLVELRYMNETGLKPGDPAKYCLELFDNGAVYVQADCNKGTGTFELVGNSLSFHLGFARAICLPGSIFDRYTKALEDAASCHVRDGQLYISTGKDGVLMQFAPAR